MRHLPPASADPDGPPHAAPRPVRAGATLVVLAAAIALLMVACGDPADGRSGPRDVPGTSVAQEPPPPTAPPTTLAPGDRSALRLALQAAEDRWRAKGITTYEHRFVPVCACDPGPLTARVLGGRLIGRPAPLPGPRTVEDWFDVIETLASTADRIDADFDDDDGVPLHLRVDPDTGVAGDEYGFDTDEFRIVTDPVARWFPDASACGSAVELATVDGAAVVHLDVTGDVNGDAALQAAADVDLSRAPGAVWFGAELTDRACDATAESAGPPAGTDDTWSVVGGTLDVTIVREHARVSIGSLTAATPAGTTVVLGDADYPTVAERRDD